MGRVPVERGDRLGGLGPGLGNPWLIPTQDIVLELVNKAAVTDGVIQLA